MRSIQRFAAVALLCSLGVSAQTLDLRELNKKGFVSYLAEPAELSAGRPGEVQLYFRIADGLHINSHTPVGNELIPTVLAFESSQDAKVSHIEFPEGTKFAFSFDQVHKLSVYSGDFVVKVRVKAMHPGNYTLNGVLHYQACDNQRCYPLKDLLVNVPLNVK